MITIDFTTKPEIAPKYVMHRCGDKHLRDQNGNLHSYNDLPAIIWENGTKDYWENGKLIRRELP